MIYIVAAVLLVVAIVVYLFFTASSTCLQCGTPVSSSFIKQMSQIANNYTLASSVGAGIAVAGPYSNLPKKISAMPLIVDGKPEVLYVGGDFCPYCAVTRWGLVIAMMRFGNFTNLTYMRSSSTDVYPNSATFSFTNYTYSSSIVHLDAFEVFDRQDNNITPSNFTQKDKFIVNSFSDGSIPFVDFGNTSIQSGAVVSPGVLIGYDWNQILAYMSDPSSTVSQAVIGSADEYTVVICRSNQTLNSTATACRQSYLKSLTG